MKYVINDHLVLSREPEGPLVAYLSPFAESLIQRGYTQRYIHRQVMLAACFSRWLKQRGTLPHHVTSQHAARYLRFRYRRRRPNQGDSAALSHFIEFLCRERVIPAEKEPTRPLTPAEQYVRAYEQYLREERVLAEATIVNYVPFIDQFLQDRFGAGPVKLSSLRARDVVQFVQRQARRLHLKRAKLLTTALRSFLQYARYCGEIRLDLATAVPSVANWSMPSIPRGIAPDQVRHLLSQIDRSTAVAPRRKYRASTSPSPWSMPAAARSTSLKLPAPSLWSILHPATSRACWKVSKALKAWTSAQMAASTSPRRRPGA